MKKVTHASFQRDTSIHSTVWNQLKIFSADIFVHIFPVSVFDVLYVVTVSDRGICFDFIPKILLGAVLNIEMIQW